MPSGTRKVRLQVSTHHPVTKENGETEWVATWHNVSAIDEKAESVVNNFSKGSLILIEGRLTYYKYTDKQGKERDWTEIRATHFLNLDR